MSLDNRLEAARLEGSVTVRSTSFAERGRDPCRDREKAILFRGLTEQN